MRQNFRVITKILPIVYTRVYKRSCHVIFTHSYGDLWKKWLLTVEQQISGSEPLRFFLESTISEFYNEIWWNAIIMRCLQEIQGFLWKFIDYRYNKDLQKQGDSRKCSILIAVTLLWYVALVSLVRYHITPFLFF